MAIPTNNSSFPHLPGLHPLDQSGAAGAHGPAMPHGPGMAHSHPRQRVEQAMGRFLHDGGAQQILQIAQFLLGPPAALMNAFESQLVMSQAGQHFPGLHNPPAHQHGSFPHTSMQLTSMGGIFSGLSAIFNAGNLMFSQRMQYAFLNQGPLIENELLQFRERLLDFDEGKLSERPQPPSHLSPQLRAVMDVMSHMTLDELIAPDLDDRLAEHARTIVQYDDIARAAMLQNTGNAIIPRPNREHGTAPDYHQELDPSGEPLFQNSEGHDLAPTYPNAPASGFAPGARVPNNLRASVEDVAEDDAATRPSTNRR